MQPRCEEKEELIEAVPWMHALGVCEMVSNPFRYTFWTGQIHIARSLIALPSFANTREHLTSNLELPSTLIITSPSSHLYHPIIIHIHHTPSSYTFIITPPSYTSIIHLHHQTSIIHLHHTPPSSHPHPTPPSSHLHPLVGRPSSACAAQPLPLWHSRAPLRYSKAPACEPVEWQGAGQVALSSYVFSMAVF